MHHTILRSNQENLFLPLHVKMGKYYFHTNPRTSIDYSFSRKVRVFPRLNSSEMVSQIAFLVAPANSAHSTGAIVWGREGSSQYLFASSEPSGEDDCRGFHRAFDLNQKKMAYEFDAKEAGDAIALSRHGESPA
jgi:hypothetical protein